MKKIIATVVLVVVCLLAFASCGNKNPIPEGDYVTKVDTGLGVTIDCTIAVRENKLYKSIWDFNKEKYTLYESYIFELNDDKTEITLTFDGYKYEGSDLALSMVKVYEDAYERGEAVGLLATKDKATSYSFELGEDYFVLNGEKYTMTE